MGCADCPAGSYNAGNVSHKNCLLCAKGTAGHFVCNDCTAGMFAANEGQTACTPCPAGKYKDTLRLETDSCDVCPAHTSTIPGATHVTQCLAISGYSGIVGDGGVSGVTA